MGVGPPARLGPASNPARVRLHFTEGFHLELETRKSHGLDQFCASLEGRHALSILDLAGANQETVSFITGLGHRLYSDDFLHQLDACFGGGDYWQNQTDPERIERFLEATLDFEDGQFDGVLIWDTLQFVSNPLLEHVMERLRDVTRQGAYMLAVFHADDKAAEAPTYAFRIRDHNTISLSPRGNRPVAQSFNNRSLEKLFEDFESVKFFLTRDHLREVVVHR